MSFENISTPEKEKDIPRITSEEWLKYSGGKKNNEEFKKWLEKKGIEFDDDGVAKVNLDGDIIETNEDDFGTINEDPDHILEKSKA